MCKNLGWKCFCFLISRRYFQDLFVYNNRNTVNRRCFYLIIKTYCTASWDTKIIET